MGKSTDSPESRSEMLSFRLTKTEWAQLEAAAGRSGFRVREYARRTLLAGATRQASLSLDFTLIQRLNRIGSLLHTLGTKMRLDGQDELPDEIRLAGREIEALLDEAMAYGPESRR